MIKHKTKATSKKTTGKKLRSKAALTPVQIFPASVSQGLLARFSHLPVFLQKKRLVFAVVTFCLLLIAFFSPLTTTLSANAADTILHPLLGETNTMYLESMYFGFEDKSNAVKYDVLGVNSPMFSNALPVKNVPVQNSAHMHPSPIPADSSLPRLSDEGKWMPLAQNLFPSDVVIASTFIRPDETRPYAIVTMVEMNTEKLGIGTQAGTYYPGGTHGVYGPGIVPKDIQQSNILLAAFNGGFQEKDGHYGMIIGNKTYVPLRIGIPALVIFTDGSVQLMDYEGQALPQNTLAVRQNGPYLIQYGQITPYIEQGADTWGRTITNSMYTWRSGLGIDKDGNVIYAVGNSLVPETLAKALKAAGAVSAIQLDINRPWVRFILYQSKGNGKYVSSPLLRNMQGGQNYLKGYNKDFFYVYKK